MSLLSGFIVSLFISMLMIPFLMKWAVKINMMDTPDARKVHQQAIPRIGGLAMFIGAIIAILFFISLQRTELSFILGGAIILIFGVLDDKYDLGYKVKFSGQILGIAIPILYGGLQITALPWLSPEITQYLSIPLTFFVLLGVINAINLSDGLDGLAGGTSLLALGLITLLAYLGGSMSVMLIGVTIIGSTLGFLRYNTHPAQIFMGDGGSQFLGYATGVLAIWVTQDVNTALSPVLPLLVLGLPIFDTMSVIAKRIASGDSPFKADKKHIHHRLLALGLGHHESVFCIYLIHSTFITTAYLVRYQSDWLVLSLFIVFSLFIIFFFEFFERGYHKKSHSKLWQILIVLRRMGKHLRFMRNRHKVAEWSFISAFILLVVYIILGVSTYSSISMDIVGLSLGLSVILLFMTQMKSYKNSIHWLDRACIYIAMAIFVYVFEEVSSTLLNSHLIMTSILVLIAITAAMHIRYSQVKQFSPTTLDYLVLFVVIVLPQLSIIQTQLPIGDMLLKVVVLFYGAEVVLSHAMSRIQGVRWGLALCLLVMSTKGWFFI